jgi:hypothetical protein
MAALTKTSTARRVRHLRLVTPTDAPTEPAIDSARPGPRDLDTVVAHFSHLLPGRADATGVFSLGNA